MDRFWIESCFEFFGHGLCEVESYGNFIPGNLCPNLMVSISF